MKTLKTLAVITGITIVLACNKTNDPITGAYVISFRNEYSIATDTINIHVYNTAAGTYEVERRGGFHRIRDGKILPKEYKQEHWMATYDKDKRVLQETAYGRQVYFNDDGRTLKYGGTYQKIK